jgi:hypothetical protein
VKVVKVTTQAELDKALAEKTACEIWIVGAGEYSLRDNGPHYVIASGSSQVRAYGSSQVTASGSSQVTAYDSSQVTASKYVAVTSNSTMTKVDGGVLIQVPAILSAQDWCEYHGVEVADGVVVLYKALGKDFHSAHGTSYAPGSVPVAPDWDGGKAECGGGLHFSPRPTAALRFAPESNTFVACPVRLSDIRAPKADDSYPEKLKAKGCCAPVWQCDIDGKRIESAVAV